MTCIHSFILFLRSLLLNSEEELRRRQQALEQREFKKPEEKLRRCQQALDQREFTLKSLVRRLDKRHRLLESKSEKLAEQNQVIASLRHENRAKTAEIRFL